MLKITGLPVRDLEHLCTGFVDLCVRHLLLFGQHTELHTWAYYTPAELCREGIRRSPPECIRTLHRGHPSAFFGVCGEWRYPWKPTIPWMPPLTVPPASRWEDIVQHVRVSRAPRGKLCIRNKKGAMRLGWAHG